MRRIVTVGVVAVVVAVVIGVVVATTRGPAPAPVAAPAFHPAPVTWGPCTDQALTAAGAQCGTVRVPLDRADPAGPTVALAVSRVRHTVPDAKYQGVVLVNPGGPGGSGLEQSTLGASVPNGVGGSYDWIGFDPRGVGASRPALSCVPTYAGYGRPDYDPATPGARDAWTKRVADYTAACDRNGGALLRHMTTVDSATDMDSIRQALGVEQITYYGYSYGTYLGQVYGTLFPDRVRRMVLDGVVDARHVWYQANLDQDVAFEKNIGIFFDWVAKYDGVYHLGNSGDDVEKLYYAQKAKLRTSPAGGVVGPSEWNDLFLAAGYNVGSWGSVATAFARWVTAGDASALKTVYEGSTSIADDNTYAVYLAVQCTDAPWPPDQATWTADNTKVAAQAPFETWGNAWYNAPCRIWPAPAGPPVAVDGSKVASTLLISETLDGATPFSGALATRRLFPTASLVEGVGGTTHAASLSGDSCVDGAVAAYLATGALPTRKPGDGSDAQCAPLPPPTPR
ncbi:alpha/beta fold hydrolase [Pseudonocardia sp. 73-21]|uniref:alpha/beta fold hydrolase n=1 Tax=unclassified Pseudonocardia TaxID=2619320 RepID=UPI000A888CB6